MSRGSRWLLAALLASAAVPAQGDAFEELALRVASVRPNSQCVVDRGSRDLVQVEDRVVLTPPNARPLTGRVVEVAERTAVVELLDPTAVVPLGTPGHVLLPKARRPVRPDPVPDQPVAPLPDDPAEEEWKPGMPLLGRQRPPRPSERPSEVRGRVYAIGSLVHTLDSFDQSIARAGADVAISNVEGDGGIVRFHGDYVYSTEFSGRTGSDLRVYELSYEHGGTRFEPFRWQAGRFLQRDMPEFGILDGIEIGYRREGGDRYGISVGYLPELDDDLESLSDLAFSIWYVWNQDPGERFTVALGYQHTLHRFESDRDLFVMRTRYLPEEGWDVTTSLWLDVYDGSDDLKSESVDITRASFFASKTEANRGVQFFYDHEEYPDLQRQDWVQTILPQTLLDAHVDRATLHLWTGGGETTRWFTRVTGWNDEERYGGAFELGTDVRGLLAERARTVLAAFAVQATTRNMIGLRIEHGTSLDSGRLDFLYELAYVNHEGFPNNRDELIQHRLAGILSTDIGAGWDGSFTADATLWDEEFSFSLGFYLQRLF